MCVICVKEKGVKMPSNETIRKMWQHNPHGGGFMWARGGEVMFSKGFMTLKDFMKALESHNFTDDDVVVMHFRISTQAGICREMTHPFPLNNRLENMKLLDGMCDVGIVHNGIIRLTSNPMEKEYSDTALFITRYMTRLIRKTKDASDEIIKDIIFELAQSKFALLDGDGNVNLIGNFEKKDGLYFSNMLHEPMETQWWEKYYLPKTTTHYYKK